jgi:hypothetical protein
MKLKLLWECYFKFLYLERIDVQKQWPKISLSVSLSLSFCLSVLVILGFEFSAWCLLGKHLNQDEMLQALFALVMLVTGPQIFPRIAWTTILLCMHPAMAAMTDMCYHAQLFLLRQSANILPGLAGTTILLMSA